MTDMDSSGEFSGRHALVTGAAQGVGEAVAELLAEQGASVLAVDISPQEPAGGPLRPRQADLADPTAVVALARELETDSEIDVLVNCAAAYPPGDLLSSADHDWSRVMQVNALAPATLCRGMARRLAHQGRPGAIVNVGSVQETLPLPGYSAYVASKGALTALTHALAVELADHQIRVNEVTLSLVTSRALRDKWGDHFWEERGVPPPTLLGRAGSPREAAEAIAFLASDRASYLTGAVLAVDGGRRLSRRPDPQTALPPPGPSTDRRAPAWTAHRPPPNR